MLIRLIAVFLSTALALGCTIADAPPLPSDTTGPSSDIGSTDSGTKNSDIATDSGAIDTSSPQELDVGSTTDTSDSNQASDAGMDMSAPEADALDGGTDALVESDSGSSDAMASDGQTSDATSATDKDVDDSSDI